MILTSFQDYIDARFSIKHLFFFKTCLKTRKLFRHTANISMHCPDLRKQPLLGLHWSYDIPTVLIMTHHWPNAVYYKKYSARFHFTISCVVFQSISIPPFWNACSISTDACHSRIVPANTRHCPSVASLLGQRRRR